MTPRRPPRTMRDLEQILNVPPQTTVTQKDIERLTRQRLGPSWGKKRKPHKP